MCNVHLVNVFARFACTFMLLAQFGMGLPDAFCNIPATLSTVPDPDLSFVVILSCTGKKETVSIVKPQFALVLAGHLHFGVCV